MSVDQIISAQPGYSAFRVERARKRELLKHLLTRDETTRFVLFVRTKHAAGRLVKQLDGDELKVLLLHNGMGKVRRSDALTAYLAGEANLLVVSDMALRGLEIGGNTGTVVNLDLPATPAAMAQRQTCMQQAQATVFMLSWDEEEAFAQLAESLQLVGEVTELEGFEPDPEAVATEKAKQAAKAAAEARLKIDKQHANGSHRQRGKPNGQQRKHHPQHANNNATWRDENGDVNGNTLSSDNSNRSAIELACEDAILRQRPGRGKSRPRIHGNR